MTVRPFGVDDRGDSREVLDKPSTTWRYGYQIGTQPARYLGTKSDRNEAIELAKQAAAGVRDQLCKLGAPTDVSWWVQSRLRTITMEFSEPQLGEL